MNEITEHWLREHTTDWSGRGIDPRRDEAEAREEYPDLTVLDRHRRAFTHPYDLWRAAGVSVCCTADVTAEHRRPGGRVVTKRVGPVQITLTPMVRRQSNLVAWTTHAVRADGTGLYHEHVFHDMSVCLGEAKKGVSAACTEGRWADAVTLVVRVLSTYTDATHFYRLKEYRET